MFRSYGKGSKVAVMLLTSVLAACDAAVLGPEFDTEVDAFVRLMNDHRTTVGCEPLTWIGEVAEVAQAHSVDMVERDFFDHTNPDGLSPFDRMEVAGVQFSRGAENIAWGYGTADAVMQGWLDSPGHRSNIENCALTEHGVGLYQTRWTHLFRTP